MSMPMRVPTPSGHLVTQNMLMGKPENRIDIYAKLREYCIRGRVFNHDRTSRFQSLSRDQLRNMPKL